MPSNSKVATATIGWRRLIVAAAMEALAHLAPPIRSLDAPFTLKARRFLRFSRFCPDYLAGRLGVAVAAELEARGYLVAADQKQYAVTTALSSLVPRARHRRRRAQADRSRRRAPMSGLDREASSSRRAIGNRLDGALLLDLGWLRRDGAAARSASLRSGFPSLRRLLQIDAVELLDPSSALSLRGRADKPFDLNGRFSRR